MRKIEIPKIGQKVKFKPFDGLKFYRSIPIDLSVIGTVIAVYPEHKWFAVAYENKGVPMRTSFKFCDIGDKAKFVN